MMRYLCFLLAALLTMSSLAALPSKDAEGNTLPSLAPLIERVSPAVVNITTFGGAKADGRSTQRSRSAGSGVVINAEEGWILSNHHVVATSTKIQVGLVDGRQFEATLVGSDPDADLALLQIQADGLQALPLADSDQLRVGDFVLAIGNPFGLGQTVTSGIVSALGRTGLGIEQYEDFIQTDASINPGNSGGALVNLQGELVGINTAIIAPGGANSGIGFAIPANMARAISEHMAAKGDAHRGTLGVSIQELTPALARAFGRPETDGGVLVSQVRPGSAAERAGIRVGDIIVAINDEPVLSAAELQPRLGVLTLNDTLELSLLRERQSLRVKARLDQPQVVAVDGGSLHPLLAGVVFDGEDERPGLAVLSVNAGSAAMQAGLRPGDRLLVVNRQRVTTAEALAKQLSGQSRLLLLVNRTGGPYFIALD